MLRKSIVVLFVAALALGGCSDDDTNNKVDSSVSDSSTTADARQGDGTTTDSGVQGDGSTSGDSTATGDSSTSGDSEPSATCSAGSGSTVCQANWSSPCGGNPIGTWSLESACTSSGLNPLGICSPGTITDNSTVSGSLSFDGSTVTRDVTFNVSLELHVPPACTGNGTVSCASIADGMNQLLEIGTATCQDSGSQSCDCTVTGQVSDSSSSSYILDGDEIVTDPGQASERRWAYCVANGVLTAMESGEGVPEEYIIQVYSCAD